jgi:hypothetical protein
MNIYYTDQGLPDWPQATIYNRTIRKNSIFLAGPTPRSQNVQSWRPEALDILQKLNFSGDVFVPEWSNYNSQIDYLNQVEWEFSALSMAESIVFWVPRNMDTMPALTTNVEFGYWLANKPKTICYGRPKNAPSTSYLDWLYRKYGLGKPFDNLEQTLILACSRCGNLQEKNIEELVYETHFLHKTIKTLSSALFKANAIISDKLKGQFGGK